MTFNYKSLGRSKGFSVAFIGQDGAGKSTVSEQICEWLNWKIEARKFYLGSGDHYHSVFKMLKTLFERENAVSKVVWATLNILDLVALSRHNKKIVFKAYRYINNGGIALFDRYPQNQFYGINDGPKIRECYYSKSNNGIIKKIVLFFAGVEEKNIRKIVQFNPDVVIKLVLSPEESIQRKPEENIDNVRIKHEIINSIKFSKSKVYTIDATMPYDEEMVKIKNIIWSEIDEKSKSIRGK